MSAANKLLTRCAWAGTSAFASADYGSSWGPGDCPSPPPTPPQPPPAPPAPYAFTDKASLKTAAQEYNADAATATATYGPIADWDVSAVTDMSELFGNLNQFNADISSWGTSGVTNMDGMFYVRSSRVPLPAASAVGSSQHAACAAAAAPRPPAPGPPLAPLFLCFPFDSAVRDGV